MPKLVNVFEHIKETDSIVEELAQDAIARAIREGMSREQATRLYGTRTYVREKAGYREDQARVPAGSGEGGQWTDEGRTGWRPAVSEIKGAKSLRSPDEAAPIVKSIVRSLIRQRPRITNQFDAIAHIESLLVRAVKDGHTGKIWIANVGQVHMDLGTVALVRPESRIEGFYHEPSNTFVSSNVGYSISAEAAREYLKKIGVDLDLMVIMKAVREKAGFREDQPRAPAGSSEGGQWTDDGATSESELSPVEFVSLSSSGPDQRQRIVQKDMEPVIKDELKHLLQRFPRVAGVLKYVRVIMDDERIAGRTEMRIGGADGMSASITIDLLSVIASPMQPSSQNVPSYAQVGLRLPLTMGKVSESDALATKETVQRFARHVTAHEFGHVLHFSITGDLPENDAVMTIKLNEARLDAATKLPTRYAYISGGEFFAENFAVWATGHRDYCSPGMAEWLDTKLKDNAEKREKARRVKPRKTVTLTDTFEGVIEDLPWLNGSERDKYDPNQPRVPAGSPDGGQWTDDGSGGSGLDAKSQLAQLAELPIGDRRQEYGKLSVGQQDRLADATVTIPKAHQALIAYAGERPNTGNLLADLHKRVEDLGQGIHYDQVERLREAVLNLGAQLDRLGVDPETARELSMSVADHLVSQEIETMGRTLGDHGIAHLLGDADTAMAVLYQIPDYFTSQEDRDTYEALVLITAAFHDTGYLTPPSRIFLDMDHPRFSMQYFDDQVAPLVVEAFGFDAANKVSGWIETHAGTQFAWETDAPGSAFRLADNLALFEHEKLPPLLRYVPGNVNVLGDMATGSITVEEAQTRMRANIERASLPKLVEARLAKAISEVSKVLPKTTLGQFGGSLRDVEWNEDLNSPVIHILREPQNPVAEHLDLGQRQFEKLAKTYGYTLDDLKRFNYLELKKGGVTVAEFVVEGETLKAGFREDQARDDRGRWTEEGASGSKEPKETLKEVFPRAELTGDTKFGGVIPKTVISTLIQLGKRFPKAAALMTEIGFFSTHSREYDHISVHGLHSTNASTLMGEREARLLVFPEKILESIRMGHDQSGSVPAFADRQAAALTEFITAHEFGHVVHLSVYPHPSDLMGDRAVYPILVDARVLDKELPTMYGLTNVAEFFADSFAAWATGHSDYVHPKMISLLEERLGKKDKMDRKETVEDEEVTIFIDFIQVEDVPWIRDMEPEDDETEDESN